MAAAPYTLFKIPAELLEPTINDTDLRTPTDEDKKAVDEALGSNGHSLLTRDDGNVDVSSVKAGDAPKIDGYRYHNEGSAVTITLKPEQIAAKQTSAKLLYEANITNEHLKNHLAFVMSVNGKNIKLVGQESEAFISFQGALDKGIATYAPTTDGAIVTLEYILVDGEGKSGIYNGRLVVCDGKANGVLEGSIWLATYRPIIELIDDVGCDAGFGFAALALLGVLLFARKRSK
ncbi:MAG: hypothetical protein LBH28_00465, partial [Oscillospiraceae bacterium]|jgi:hypothetical protein|nr:hypothetical protein [Oscillospiraceae bacterium]